MKIVQIATAPSASGLDTPELFGLDEQGNVWIYRRAAEPFVTRVPVTDPDRAIQQYYNDRARGANIGQSVDQMLNDINDICGIPDLLDFQQTQLLKKQIQKEQEARHRHDMERLRILGQVPAGSRYVDQFHDGWTEGWEPLKMGISKPVPHPDDPTRNERA